MQPRNRLPILPVVPILLQTDHKIIDCMLFVTIGEMSQTYYLCSDQSFKCEKLSYRHCGINIQKLVLITEST